MTIIAYLERTWYNEIVILEVPMGAIEQMCRELMAVMPPVSPEEQARLDLESQEIDRQRAEQEEIDRGKLDRLRIEYDVVASYKLNLSGLTERGCHKSGGKNNTVNHALCLKDLSCGRISRKSETFLCGVNHGSFGYVISPLSEVSCPRCASIAQKNGLKSCSDPILKRLDRQL
jgi:hypothetical protein